MPKNRLRELREENNLLAAEVAQRVGVDASTVSRWENQIGGIPDHRKQQLAEMFKVSVAFLMGWADVEIPGRGDDSDASNGASDQGAA